MKKPGAARRVLLALGVTGAMIGAVDAVADQPVVEFRADERLFTLYAGFNACGYDDENISMSQPFSGTMMSLPRIQARQYLQKNPDAFVPFCRFLADHQQPWFMYSHFVLALSGPPDFRLDFSVLDQPDREWIKPLNGLEQALAEFHRAARIKALWKTLLPAYNDELNHYRAKAGTWVAEVRSFFGEPPAGKKLVVTPNLLESHGRADVKTQRNSVYILTPPRFGGQDEQITIVHEYLHLVTRPVVDQMLASFQHAQTLFAAVADLPEMAQNYSTPFLWLDESFVHALTLIIAGSPPQVPEDRWLNSLVLRGYFLVPYLFKGAKESLTKGSQLKVLLPAIIENLQPEQALRDFEQLKLDYQRSVDAKKPKSQESPSQ